MSREDQIESFVQLISEPKYPNMHNPWRDVCATEIRDDGYHLRKERLKRHMNAPNPRLLLVGEAPGYQGCRFSGVAFTSERQLLERQIPRMEGLDGERITDREIPWSEPSATIVWNALRGHGHELAEGTVMFNAVPWHPEGDSGCHSNRTPTPAEKARGVQYLRLFLDIYSGIPVAALGNIASDTLVDLGVEHTKLRHPANGGATKFRTGLAELVAQGV